MTLPHSHLNLKFMNTIAHAFQINNVTPKKGGKQPISATYASSNACMLHIHPPEYGFVVPAALPIRPPQQCTGLFLALGEGGALKTSSNAPFKRLHL